MQYSRKREIEIDENGVEFDMGSVFARLSKLTGCSQSEGDTLQFDNDLDDHFDGKTMWRK